MLRHGLGNAAGSMADPNRSGFPVPWPSREMNFCRATCRHANFWSTGRARPLAGYGKRRISSPFTALLPEFRFPNGSRQFVIAVPFERGPETPAHLCNSLQSRNLGRSSNPLTSFRGTSAIIAPRNPWRIRADGNACRPCRCRKHHGLAPRFPPPWTICRCKESS